MNGDKLTNLSEFIRNHQMWDQGQHKGPVNSPSSDLIRDFFLFHIEKYKAKYKQVMKSWSINAISADHTFRVSANVGFYRSKERYGILAFDSLFLIMNQDSQVVEHRFPPVSAIQGCR